MESELTEVCLVTGGAGFIGTAISARLSMHFDRVVAIDALHPQVHPQRKRPAALDRRVELLVRDVTDQAAWEDLLREVSPTVVVHLAAETGTGQSLSESNRHAAVNVCGTTTMLDALLTRSKLPTRIVLASSRAIYGEGAWEDSEIGQVSYPGQRSSEMLKFGQWDFPGKRPLPHSSLFVQPSPTSVYGATKLAQEHILSCWASSLGVQISTLRLQNVYGPGQSLANPYTGIVSLFAQLARNQRSIPLYEDGKMTRDFIYIDDVVEAIVKAAIAAPLSRIPYDIGSGNSIPVMKLAELIADYFQAPPPHITGQFRNGDVRHASCDITRSSIDLDWQPKWELSKGVFALCEWIEQQGQ